MELSGNMVYKKMLTIKSTATLRVFEVTFHKCSTLVFGT